ncbi:MAG: hypothetical protein KGH54_00305 [Candidatus Micrarchaeota archaeon]|nr:hypothetical protein [Candidatus Micrarchaeota archaeon]
MNQFSGKIKVSDFDLKYTVESAQPLTFLADILDDGKQVGYVLGSNHINVKQEGDVLRYGSVPGLSRPKLKKEIEKRFALKEDMQKIYERIATDKFLADSIERYPGMRVTENDPWETTVCFVISQFNNVKRIRLIVRKLIDTYGEKTAVELGGKSFVIKSFPTPQALARQSVKDLMKCGTGFRGKYIKGVAEACTDSFDLYKLYNKKYHMAKEELMTLPGIGDKVADCILLMGYRKPEAFPVDTWIKRIVERVYFNGRKQSVKAIHKFADDRWPGNQGVVQQYIFWAGRSLKIK